MKKLIAKILSLAMVLQMASPMAVVRATEREETQEESIASISESMEDMASLSLAEQFALSQVMPISGTVVFLGTEDTPFLLSNVSQLQELATYVNDGDTNFNAAHYKLTQDVSLSSVASWTPIGNEANPFQGTFDGNGKIISNLTIDSTANNQGFFGYTSGATIEKLGIENGSVSGGGNVGALAGVANTTKIYYCYSTGVVTGSGDNVGGLVGDATSGTIRYCYSTGVVTGSGDNVGGLVGGATSGTIYYCYSTATVTGTGDYVGGVAGYAYPGIFYYCYATGAVSGADYVGGVVGQAQQTTSSVALNPSISSTGTNVNRVVGKSGGSVGMLYGWACMDVNGKTVSGTMLGNPHGLDLKYDSSTGLSTQFIDIFGSSNTAWSYTTDGLPTLKDVGGNQSSELPSYMKVEDTIKYISTVAELQTLATEVNSGEDKSGITYLLMNDLDLSSVSNWTAIGKTSTLSFNGTFDGNGHVISNLTISTSSYFQGLFGYIKGATIQNLGVIDCNIYGYSSVGAVAGAIYSSSTITNCYATGSVSGTGSNVGGLVGYVASSNITNCYATATVSGGSNIGGLVGYFYKETIQNCYATGEVSGNNYVGGLVGYITSESTTKNSVALNPSVTGSGSDVNRVEGSSSGALISNYAWSGMTVMENSSPVSVSGSSSDANGEDLTYSLSTGLSKQFKDIFDTDVDDGAWTYTTNGLPILASIGGNQSSTLPSYITVGKPSTDIYTVGDLQALATWVNDGNNCSSDTYTLMNDLDLTGVEWTPIGTSTHNFSGTFDGGNNVISNLTITGTSDYQGLFGNIAGATIKNLGIENCSVSGGRYVGALVGYDYSDRTTSIIQNCYATGVVSGTDYIGGLVGSSTSANDDGNATIENCYATVAVSGTGSNIGGLVGNAAASGSAASHTIKNCYATGAVSGYESIGGLVGYATKLTIQNCYATGVVSGSGTFNVGGLVGYTANGAIEKSLALNTSITAPASSANRVLSTYNTTLSNLYAWKDMLVNGDMVPGGTTTNENGADLSVKDGIFVDEYGVSIYRFFDSDIWTIPTANNGDYMLLPSLKGVGNDVPSIYLSQTLEYEAEINLKEYKTLEEAVTAAQDNETIKLLANVKLESVVAISNEITLDLNGFDIKQTGSSQSVISVGSSNNFTLKDSGSGGSISGGSAAQGGGVNVTGTLNLSGGTITGNTASTKGGGVYFDGTAFNLSGLVDITGNTVNSEDNNVYLPSRKEITINGDLDTNTRIGITTAETPTDSAPVVFTSGASTKNTSVDNFTSDNSAYDVVETDDGEYALAVGLIFSSGDGSEEAPYIITTQKELKTLATVVNNNEANGSGKSYKGLSYKLGNDIDIGSNENWTPIGNSSFEGTFDGAGFEVQNLTIGATNGNDGLFGNNTGTIKNLSVSGTITVTGSGWTTFVGGIAGTNSGNGVIDGCHSSVEITLTGSGSYLLAGGITGENSSGTIRNSSNSGDVSSTGSASNHEAGGIAGTSERGTVENCYNEGVISGTKNAGGIIGRNGESSSSTLKNSYSSSSSVTGSTNVGAVVGWNGASGTIENCYWLASETLTKAIGSGTGTDLVSFGTTGAFTSGVTIDSKEYNTVLSALQAWVLTKTGGTYYSWKDEAYPIFNPLITLDENDFSFTSPSDLVYDGDGKDATVTYSGTSSPAPTFTVYYEGTDGTSYSKTTTPPTDAGTYKVTIDVNRDTDYVEVTGITDSAWEFTITKALDESDFTFSAPSDLVYDGNEKEATFTTSESAKCTVYYEGTDSTSYGPSITPPTDVGDYKVTINVTGDTDYAEVTGITDSAWEFEITAKNVSSLTVTAIPDQIHTGSALTPTVTITGLVEGRDFTVSYTDNTAVGTANVVITGIGNYSGTLSTTFQIELSAYASLAEEFEDKLDQLDTSPTTYDDIRDVLNWYENLTQDQKDGIDAYDSGLKGRLEAYTNTLPKEITVDTAVGSDNCYIVGDTFDPSDFVVTLTTQDGTKSVLDTTDWTYTLSIGAEDDSGNLTAGTHTLTITYDKLTITTTIVVLDIFDISGTVVDSDNKPLADVQVELYQKGVQIAETITDSDGKFSFTNEPEGVYNLVATQDVGGANEVVKTILVILIGNTDETVVMPDVGRNSLVELPTDTEVLAVGGVDEVAGDFVLKEDETVEVTLAITEVKDAEMKAEIFDKTEEEETVGLWLDISLSSVITDLNGVQLEESMIEISNLLEIVIELPLDLQNKEGYAIYREHEGDIHKIYTTENEEGEYIVVDGNCLTLHTKKFSTYALVVSDAVITDPTSGGGTTDDGNTGGGSSPSKPEGDSGNTEEDLEDNTQDDSDNSSGNSSNSSSSGGSYYSSTRYPNTLVETNNGEVSLSTNNASSGTKVTITTSPEDGFEVDTVTVLRDSTGAEITVTDNGDGTFTFTQPSGKVTIEITFKEVIMEEIKVFTDVSWDDWFRNVVYLAYDSGLMIGTSDTTFSPNAEVTRGMFVQTLYNLSGEDDSGSEAPFTDLIGTEYYAEAVAWAWEHDVVAGYDDGTFRGEKFITREELMQILYRYVGEEKANATFSYQDSTEIALWAKEAVTWGTRKGLVSGREGSVFDPQGNATRGELAQILVNFMELTSLKRG